MRVLISRPLLYKSSALPTELIRLLQSGIEPESSVWKTDILPLNYWRDEATGFDRFPTHATGLTRTRTEITGTKARGDNHYTISPFPNRESNPGLPRERRKS
jgi:hypothetical protein